MTRLRIYLGSFFLLLGAPLFIACLFDHSIGAGPFIASATMISVAAAALWPERWTQ